ncbi:Lrp/AsnC family transcriptional regulator [Desulfovibrio sp. OttesenSCG-928-G15]|nr:Lrp/AsnC family transcriptional regulator [Desulfovibrio sp. OttesenSCG-928-G15]
MNKSPRVFSDKERAILRIVQKNIPDSLTPFADIAQMTGASEEEVLALLVELSEQGAIRRFGVSLKHQKAGFTHNAMVAWMVTPEIADECGKMAAKNPMISHCYYRPSDAPDWPYELYTMIHGKSADDYEEVIEQLINTTPLKEYAVLQSIRELKKTSMTYF